MEFGGDVRWKKRPVGPVIATSSDPLGRASVLGPQRSDRHLCAAPLWRCCRSRLQAAQTLAKTSIRLPQGSSV